jgi:hypothetical protein
MAEGLSKLFGHGICTRLAENLKFFRGESHLGSISSIRKLDISPNLWNAFQQLEILYYDENRRLIRSPDDNAGNPHIMAPPDLSNTLRRLSAHLRLRGSQLNDLSITLRLPEAKILWRSGDPEKCIVDLSGLCHFNIRPECVHIVLQERRDPSTSSSIAKDIAVVYTMIDREVERVAKIVICGDSEAKTGWAMKTWVVCVNPGYKLYVEDIC